MITPATLALDLCRSSSDSGARSSCWHGIAALDRCLWSNAAHNYLDVSPPKNVHFRHAHGDSSVWLCSIPDIMQHYADCIVRAEKEVL